ncbi:hypothetical protein PP753_gp05 [Dinoroseobacter phage vB_DshP-R7L]|uniref:Uncharacterized protein n=1 Tax=Dinoroseobacter phage vB_DshP-R7L TaxID=2873349 RepID=A0AAE9BML6_9CAUD|nr:hypothetical protein PP753_gp05 [Dinoroseobacter phage vB_DshP-R7L]UAT28844.1 hypothetical protein R7L_gp5 [Dinoroseobacter phage vB_DshP-R7L]
MNRLALFLILLCSNAQAQDFMDRQTMEEYQQLAWERGCENPKNMDRWGIREPTEEEVMEFGSGIMVFFYYNSPQGCSSDTTLGIWRDRVRWGTMVVKTGGADVDHNERITFTLEDIPYDSLGHSFLLVPDAKEPHRIILYPMIM